LRLLPRFVVGATSRMHHSFSINPKIRNDERRENRRESERLESNTSTTINNHDEISSNDGATICHSALSSSAFSVDFDECLCADCDTTTKVDNDTIALFIIRIVIDFTCLQAPSACARL
jgi:CCR4-NOT transcriptional regulation complex NOT5 subunit